MDKYETFIHTGMGASFNIASPQKSSAKFDHALVRDEFRDLYYQPFWRGDSLYLKEFRLAGRDTIYKHEEQINYIVGSGQHTNSHMTRVESTKGDGAYVFQVPATFYTQKQQWDLPPGFEDGNNSRFSRKIELECMTCHNGYPNIVDGSENKYTYIARGIDCERCHGPGGQHVREKQQGKLVDITKEIDYTIVNPAKMSIDRQLDVCQRCHIQGNAVLKPDKNFFDFRPGMKLTDVMDVYMPLYKGDVSTHIMASHVERLKMSPCFIVSKQTADKAAANSLFPYKNAMTCVTCHDPHISVKTTTAAHFNAVCGTCHGGTKQVSAVNCTEDLQVRIKMNNNNCVGCHMPKNSTIDIPHVSVTDHFIRKIPLNALKAITNITENDLEKIKQFVGLACISNPTPDNYSRGVAFLNYFEKFESKAYLLDSAAKYFADNTTDAIQKNFDPLVRLNYLRGNYPQVTRYAETIKQPIAMLTKQRFKNDNAWTSYRIGEAYYKTGSLQQAETYYQHAVTLAPFQLDFINKLALVQFDMRKYAEARKNLEFIISENPKYVSAYVSLGYLVLLTEENPVKADSLYNKALALDPDNEQALLNKVGILMYRENKAEAKKLLKRILILNPSNAKAKLLVSKLSS